jgi:hypothetical protein
MSADVNADDLPVFFRAPAEPGGEPEAAFQPRKGGLHGPHEDPADETNITKPILFNGEAATSSACAVRRTRVGYWIADFWGQGIATQALGSFGRNPVASALRRCCNNLGSRRVLEKCGFTVLGEDRFSYGTPEEEFEEFTLILNGQSDDKA